MKAIKENIVGLLRFIRLLFQAFILPSRSTHRRVKDYSSKTLELTEKHKAIRDECEKYKALIGPNEPLIPTETVFCPKCHVVATQLRRLKDGVQIIQHGKVLVTVGGNITVTKDGKETRGFPLKCPNGHVVEIE